MATRSATRRVCDRRPLFSWSPSASARPLALRSPAAVEPATLAQPPKPAAHARRLALMAPATASHGSTAGPLGTWRMLAALAVCQALMTTVIAITQSLASIEARDLSGDVSLSGTGLAAQLAGAIVALVAMQSVVGQRRRLLLTVGFGALTFGASVAAAGRAIDSFPLFLAGNAILGGGAATALLLRSLVGDRVPLAERGRAIAVVASAGIAGAISSPIVIEIATRHLGVAQSDRAVAPWVAAALVASVGLAVAATVPLTPAAASDLSESATTSESDPERSRIAIRTAMAATSAAGIAMVAMMATVAVQLKHVGASRSAISTIMAAHYAGMYGFALPFGAMSDRFGRRSVLVICSLLVIASALAFASDPHEYRTFAVVLLLLGSGWSGIFVASTALFTETGRFERRSRAVARNDLVVVVLSSAAALVAGVIYARSGPQAVGLSIVLMFTMIAAGTRFYERAA